jgi:hypothetical protein
MSEQPRGIFGRLEERWHVVRAGFVTAMTGLTVALLSSTPFLLVVLLTEGDEVPDDFDILMRGGLGLGGVLAACGSLAAALGAAFRRPRATGS